MSVLAEQAKIAHALTKRDDILLGATQHDQKGFFPYAIGQTIYAPMEGLSRGALDLAAFWLAYRHHSNGDFLPKSEERQALTYLDLARCAAIAAEDLPGVKANIAEHIESHNALNLPESLFRAACVHALGTLPESHAFSFNVTKNQWERLFALKHDAEAFRLESLALLHGLFDESKPEPGEDDPTLPDQTPPEQAGAQPDKNQSADETESKDAQKTQSEEEAQSEKTESDTPSETPQQHGKNDIASGEESGEYHVYTREFDKTLNAAELGTPEEASALRHALDAQKLGRQGFIVKLARQLEAALRAQDIRHTEREMEDGTLDTTRLARIVAAPARSNIYQIMTQTPARNTIVSLLVDNSGSMRGRPIMTAMLAADVLALTLERCGVPCEILGFTTRSWKGGRARVKWTEDKRPINPGRLNDLAHIVYKDVSTPWRRARLNIALATKDGILKENIDGEALLWASERLMARPEPRKILLVISDGAPVDDSTLSANDSQYLERHLQAVVKKLGEMRGLEVHAIGIGHDVTHTYPSAMTIRDVEELGPKLLEHLAGLFRRS